mgnify:CR=1 FL=1
MSSRYNISAIQGSTLLLNINLTDINNAYINLQGYGVRGHVRSKFSDSGILFNLNPQIHPTSYISGLITISGSATGLAAVPIGQHNFDIEVTGASDYVLKALVGYFNVDPEVTR